MPYQLASSQLDDTHTWQNANDRISYERAFTEGDAAQKRCAVALMTADRSTPESFIRSILTVSGVPPRYGYSDEPLTLDAVFGGGLPSPHINDAAPTDYSGTNAGYTGSDRNVSVLF